jgi:uncharacterized YigZ family protein
MQHQLTSPVFHTLEVKKSKFITWLVPCENSEQSKDWLIQARAKYPDARHYCWAYTFYNGTTPSSAMNDDGEPSGTAGKPLLNVINHKPNCNVMVIVIRYFGGIKLGAGGLVRAYSQAAELAFQKAVLTPIVAKSQLKVTTDFAQEQWIRHQLQQLSGEILSIDYQQSVSLKVELPSDSVDTFIEVLQAKSISYQIRQDLNQA